LTDLTSSHCIKGNHKFPKGKTKMSSEEATCPMGESVRYSRRKLSEIECESRKLELPGTISRNLC
jgi:hypothetical protein